MPHRLVAVLVFVIILAGCADRRTPIATAPTPPAGTYIDVRPGWRLSVITPLFRSGKLKLERDAGVAETTGPSGTPSLTVQAGSDFLGYEKSVYTVESRGNRIRVRFKGAEMVRDGNAAPQKKPTQRLFQLPRNTRHIRLVYLTRASDADHNMAIVAAARFEELQSMTRDVQTDPARGCQTRRDSVCHWVPAGIAVRPEMRRSESDTDWVPAR